MLGGIWPACTSRQAAPAAYTPPEQQVELVLDISRNASNKFAVSMAADGANVTEGYEVYDVKPDGSIASWRADTRSGCCT